MQLLSRMSIRARLYFGTIFSLVLLVVIGAMGYLALERTRSTLDVLFSERVQTLTEVAELRTTLGDVRRAEKDIIISFNNAVEVAALRESWKKSLGALNKGLADIGQVQAKDPAFTEAIKQSLAELKEYETGISPVFEQIERAQVDGAVGGAYAEKLKKHVEGADKLLAQLAVTARTQMDEARAGVNALTTNMSGLIGVVLALALLVLVPLTFFSVRSITRSIADANALAERIAGGDLSQDVVASSGDEVGQLVASMARMQDALRGLVQHVAEAANSISTASAEIASGNHDLSHRTEQTAANLQEAASSMELLTGTIGTTLIAYPFTLNLGSILGGATMRYRLYSRQGVPLASIGQVIGQSILINWLGYSLLAGAVFWLWAPSLPDGWSVDPHQLRWVGWAMGAATLAYLVACMRRQGRPFLVRGHSVPVPSLPVGLSQVALSATNWMVMGAAVWMLAQGKAPYVAALATVLLGAVAGLISRIPAGLGVLEAVGVAVLSPYLPAPQALAAILAYRALYFFAPLALATVAFAVVEWINRKKSKP